MKATERRSGRDRRTSERFEAEVDIEWHIGATRRPGTISDLSDDGCFVLSDGDVEDGDSVRLLLPEQDGQLVELAGVVTNHLIEVGFGLRFTDIGPAEAAKVAALRIRAGSR